jgi:hypothetical protein
MDSNNLNNPKIIKIGRINPHDQQLLIEREHKTIKFYTISLIIAIILFWTIAGIVIAFALFIVRKKELAKLKLLEAGTIDLYKVKGTLSIKAGADIPFYYIDGYRLPYDYLYKVDKYKGQTITVEFYPKIFAIRCHYDVDGNGYNYISRTEIS